MGSFPKALQARQHNAARQHGGSTIDLRIEMPQVAWDNDATYDTACRLVLDALNQLKTRLILIDDEVVISTNIPERVIK